MRQRRRRSRSIREPAVWALLVLVMLSPFLAISALRRVSPGWLGGILAVVIFLPFALFALGNAVMMMRLVRCLRPVARRPGFARGEQDASPPGDPAPRIE